MIPMPTWPCNYSSSQKDKLQTIKAPFKQSSFDSVLNKVVYSLMTDVNKQPDNIYPNPKLYKQLSLFKDTEIVLDGELIISESFNEKEYVNSDVFKKNLDDYINSITTSETFVYLKNLLNEKNAFQKLEEEVNQLGLNYEPSSSNTANTVKAKSIVDYEDIKHLFSELDNSVFDDKKLFCKAIGIDTYGLCSISIDPVPKKKAQDPTYYEIVIEKYIDKIPF